MGGLGEKAVDDEDPVFETLTGSNGGGFEFSLDEVISWIARRREKKKKRKG